MVRKATETVKAETQEPEAPSPDAYLTRFVGYDLKRLFNLVQGDLTRVLGPFNLRIISYSVLSVVARSPGINQTRLAEALKLERSNLVQIVDELSSRGLLTRNPIENNRRSHALLATPEGMALIESVDLEVVAHEEKLFSELSPAELTTLRHLLLKARQSIEQRMSAAD
ncbi:MarR family winged helix-turn-helix transcriptional regulator [Rhizobium rhizoryzae]|uniref:DNA-binding MarR family transcriptional regulator n=1 Tax=Rhizobium rhizoryzae TaxID=451876 RepID=A0A7W6PT15_9HYPH|nr:MarR family transcriptional regulator [Rhizobium rhizoryzae]MBB4146113.1 DNA-binding MarR family transcriptional regulator [Rhizobium rhizoryzae]